MLRNSFLLCAAAVAAATAPAESLKLNVSMEFESYVVHEAATVTLNITDFGATPFIVDDYGEYTANSVELVVRHETDGFQDRIREGAQFGSVMVTSGATETLTCRLNDWFRLTRQGRYTVQAVAHRGGEVVYSSLISFMVVNGLEILTEVHPVPGEEARTRRYTLLYLSRNQHEDLFLRVDDMGGGGIVALFRLGAVMRYEKPRIEFGADGQLAVVHQIARDRFVRTRLVSNAETIKVLDRQQLVDPNHIPAVRSILEARSREMGEGVPVESFRRRERGTPEP